MFSNDYGAESQRAIDRHVVVPANVCSNKRLTARRLLLFMAFHHAWRKSLSLQAARATSQKVRGSNRPGVTSAPDPNTPGTMKTPRSKGRGTGVADN
jgi:hypothetical protein